MRKGEKESNELIIIRKRQIYSKIYTRFFIYCSCSMLFIICCKLIPINFSLNQRPAMLPQQIYHIIDYGVWY